MTYIDGFLVAVPRAKKAEYKALAERAMAVWLDHGATRYVESWADDVPAGKINDFRTAVIAEEGEEVVFSWIEWPSKEARDTGNAKVMADPRLKMEGEEMPFSGERMIYGGFAMLLDSTD